MCMFCVAQKVCQISVGFTGGQLILWFIECLIHGLSNGTKCNSTGSRLTPTLVAVGLAVVVLSYIALVGMNLVSTPYQEWGSFIAGVVKAWFVDDYQLIAAHAVENRALFRQMRKDLLLTRKKEQADPNAHTRPIVKSQ